MPNLRQKLDIASSTKVLIVKIYIYLKIYDLIKNIMKSKIFKNMQES